MSRQSLFVLVVLAIGVALTSWIGIGALDLNPARNAAVGPLAVVLFALAGLPAILAALKPRRGLIVLGAVTVLPGAWAAWLLNQPGEEAIGGAIVLSIIAASFIYGLAVIGLRSLLIKNPTI
jgi:hypothetical protein